MESDFERSGDGWSGYIGGPSPVQGCGHVDGHPWYFRARWSAYSLEIAEDKTIDPEALPWVGIGGTTGWMLDADWGKLTEASYMPLDVAWSLIEDGFKKFRAGTMTFIISE